MKNENMQSKYHYLYFDLIPLNSNVIVLTTTKKRRAKCRSKPIKLISIVPIQAKMCNSDPSLKQIIIE